MERTLLPLVAFLLVLALALMVQQFNMETRNLISRQQQLLVVALVLQRYELVTMVGLVAATHQLRALCSLVPVLALMVLQFNTGKPKLIIKRLQFLVEELALLKHVIVTMEHSTAPTQLLLVLLKYVLVLVQMEPLLPTQVLKLIIKPLL
jgi:hypothetical protein